ncbi:DUF3300 domain-containing protein [Undibacterium sp. TJN25]|uniref:DUF3300 domain-containing protein n=1 Tax=Undibacterium sp. TJN25 TaxID=3413056 RepID=UPI003BF24C3E
MKRFSPIILAYLICLPGAVVLPIAGHAQAQAAPLIYSQQELDQLLAPIALYPDPLLSQVLMAATYPIETVQASRFVRQNPSLRGNALAQAVANQPWDPSVKSLTQFPAVLAMMDDQLAWTQKLGDAFLAQQGSVMDTVQSLRARAQATGSLRSNQQQRVLVQDGDIDIEPYAQDVIYVPYYNPTVVYGNWWWPDRRPMVWQPPVAYQSPSYGSAIATGIAFGIGVGIVASIFDDARPDWRRHNFVTNRGPSGNRLPAGGAVWAHNPEHRHGVAYRDAPTRERFQPQAGSNANRDAYRGRLSAGGAPRPPGAGSTGVPQAHTAPNVGNVRNAPNTLPPPGTPSRGRPGNFTERQVQASPATPAPAAVGPTTEVSQRVPHAGRPQRGENEQQRAVQANPPSSMQPNPQQTMQPRAQPNLPPREIQRPAMERSHPLMPAGPANAAQSNADRGRASREAHGFNPGARAAPPPRPAQAPQAPAPRQPQAQQQHGPAAPQGPHPRSH